MALTTAERQRRYVEKRKEANKDKYMEEKREYAKTYYRKSIRQIKEEEPEEETKELPKLEPITKRVKKINKSKLGEETKHQYIITFKRIYKSYNKKEYEDDEDLKKLLNNETYNVRKLNKDFNFIRKNTEKIIKEYYKDINVIYSLVSRLKFFNNTIKTLYPYLKYRNEEYDKERIEQKTNKDIDEKIKLIDFNKEEVLYKLNNSKLEDEEKLIYGLFMLYPVRRYIDYNRMKILKEEPKDKLNNYYYNGKFYFYIQKNKREYISEVPKELDELINKEREWLLGKSLTSSNLSVKIIKVFNKVYNVSISSRELRHLYATYMNDKYKNLKERMDICEMIGHNVVENMKYSYK